MSPVAPPWLANAEKHVGLAEIPGKDTAPTIRRWLLALKAWWQDDETPWCGVYVAEAMREAGMPLPQHWYRAKGWLDWGYKLDAPVFGCVVIFEREGGGHVGFAVGRNADGRLLVLGGNQGNRVSVAPFDQSRVIGYRWPLVGIRFARLPLPVTNVAAGSSRYEV